jgi:hypothetical protein
MLRIFLQFLALGVFLTAVAAVGQRLLHAWQSRRVVALARGTALRCVRPLDLGGS